MVVVTTNLSPEGHIPKLIYEFQLPGFAENPKYYLKSGFKLHKIQILPAKHNRLANYQKRGLISFNSFKIS